MSQTINVNQPDEANQPDDDDRPWYLRFVDWWRLRAERLSDPETVASTAIVVVIGFLAGIGGGIIAAVIVVALALTLHMAAVENGHFALLWLVTAMLLLLLLIAFSVLLFSVPPLLYTLGGAVALAHNELVRINFARRRNAIVDSNIFSSSAIGVAAATGIGLVATMLAQVFSLGTDRNWLWVALAFALLAAAGIAVAFFSARNATSRDREPFEPGKRIPPQPLAKDTMTNL